MTTHALTLFALASTLLPACGEEIDQKGPGHGSARFHGPDKTSFSHGWERSGSRLASEPPPYPVSRVHIGPPLSQQSYPRLRWSFAQFGLRSPRSCIHQTSLSASSRAARP